MKRDGCKSLGNLKKMSKTAVTQKIVPSVIFAIEMAFINYELSPILKTAEIAGERHLLAPRRQFERNSRHQDLVLYIYLDFFYTQEQPPTSIKSRIDKYLPDWRCVSSSFA
jgi:hypothetical protein